MISRFHPDSHGEVVGESRRDDSDSWLGMHYPAEDIPRAAREIFVNLFANAMTYNDHSPCEIERGWRDPESRGPDFFEHDNGIGSAAGLAIVKTLVDQHRGRVWLESTLGQSTPFSFTHSAPVSK